MTRPLAAHIDLAALRHNLATIRRAAPASRVMAVIKANGYGHGMVRTARALGGADAFGVASIDEAVILREAGVRRPITLLEGFFETSELDPIVQYELAVVIHDPGQLAALCSRPPRTPPTRPVEVWLKIDTGMHRLGFAPEIAKAVWRQLAACAWVKQPPGLMTHLACADDRNDETTLRQLECFSAATEHLPGARSVANSAGILGWPRTRFDWVRPGITLYGVSPFIDTLGADHGLRPVMTLRSCLIAVNPVRKGEGVGYGKTWTCPEDMTVGIVAAGYGDGYPRHAGPDTPVLVNGARAPLIGRVSMDMLCVDLRHHPDARVGDPVVLWGDGLPVEEVARHASTIPYELLCGISQRVPVVEDTGAEAPAAP